MGMHGYARVMPTWQLTLFRVAMGPLPFLEFQPFRLIFGNAYPEVI